MTLPTTAFDRQRCRRSNVIRCRGNRGDAIGDARREPGLVDGRDAFVGAAPDHVGGHRVAMQVGGDRHELLRGALIDCRLGRLDGEAADDSSLDAELDGQRPPVHEANEFIVVDVFQPAAVCDRLHVDVAQQHVSIPARTDTRYVRRVAQSELVRVPVDVVLLALGIRGCAPRPVPSWWCRSRARSRTRRRRARRSRRWARARRRTSRSR